MENIVEIQEEVRIPQGDQEIILEKGDKIKVLNESWTPSPIPKNTIKKLSSEEKQFKKDLDELSDKLKILTSSAQKIKSKDAEKFFTDTRNSLISLQIRLSFSM